jgi:hypothetical protein
MFGLAPLLVRAFSGELPFQSVVPGESACGKLTPGPFPGELVVVWDDSGAEVVAVVDGVVDEDEVVDEDAVADGDALWCDERPQAATNITGARNTSTAPARLNGFTQDDISAGGGRVLPRAGLV